MSAIAPVVPLFSVTRAIDQEPELPDEMPEEMWAAFKSAVASNNKAFVTEILRIIVRETKDGIRERVIAEFSQQPPI